MKHPLQSYSDRTKVPLYVLAQQIGVSDGTLYRYVTGRRRPSLDMMARLEKATGGGVRAIDLFRAHYAPLRADSDRPPANGDGAATAGAGGDMRR